MRYALLGMLALVLSGCLTDREALYLQQQFYNRADIDAINAEAECKRLARNLVQVARCSNRR
jgi:starvation-inducible outer membrane lipoprotein